MTRIPAAAAGVLAALVLVLAVVGGTDSPQTGLSWLNAGNASTTGVDFECAVDDADALESGLAASNGWRGAQAENATAVYLVALEHGLGDHAAFIGLIAAYQESRLYNYANFNVDASLEYAYDRIGQDHDSIGIFKHRPRSGWGSVRDLMNPRSVAGEFYDRLATVDGWESMEPTQAAQAVQDSAFPDAYARWEDYAGNAIEHFAEQVSCVLVGGAWTDPVPEGTFWGGFRTSERPTHDGLDFGGDKGADILAAGDGTVVRSKCGATLDGEDYSCDVDGSPEVSGCGWYVDIEHPDQTVTRYCHMESEPLVAVGDTVVAGQVIGHVGSSGNSSAPHLHFETHVGGDPATSENAVSPIEYLAERGVTVG